MHYTKHTISSFIHQADVLVKNSREVDAIRSAVNKYGYGKSEIDKGDRLLAELRRVTMQQHVAKSEKVQNYKLKQILQAKIHKTYMKYVKLARIGFSEDIMARKALLLDGARGRVYSVWVFQVSSFCSIMLDEEKHYLTVMRRFGIEKADFEVLKEQLQELSYLSDKCLESVGELRKLTAQRQKKVIEVQHYVSDFVKIARIALEYSPQLLESLGVSVRS